MKKFLTIAMVAGFVLTLAATTYALEISASGYMRMMNTLNVNVGDELKVLKKYGADDDNHGTEAYIHHRFRLKMKVKSSDNLEGVLYLENDDFWGDLPDEKKADGDLGDKDQGIPVGADRIDVEVKQAYMSFKVPGLDAYPTRALVGVIPSGLGKGNIGKEVAGIRTDTKIGMAKLRLLYYKAVENQSVGKDFTGSDDMDHLGFRLSVPLGDLTWAVHGNWQDVPKGGAGLKTTAGTAASSNLYWLGFDVNGKVGPAKVVGNFAYNGGTVDYRDKAIAPDGSVIDEDEYGGWVTRVKASIPVGMWTIGAEGLYVSGDDTKDTAKGEYSGFRELEGGSGYDDFGVYYAGDVNYYIGHDHFAPVGGTGLSGDWFVRVFGTTKPLDWLTLTLTAGYIGDNVDNGDRVGTSLKSDLVTPEDNSDVGFEVDAIAWAKIYKQLKFGVQAGILFAGDALDQFDAAKGKNVSPDDPWIFNTQLKYSF